MAKKSTKQRRRGTGGKVGRPRENFPQSKEEKTRFVANLSGDDRKKIAKIQSQFGLQHGSDAVRFALNQEQRRIKSGVKAEPTEKDLAAGHVASSTPFHFWFDGSDRAMLASIRRAYAFNSDVDAVRWSIRREFKLLAS